MISILRKSLTGFLSNHASVSSTLHRCFLSTSNEGESLNPPSVLDSSHDFSPQSASKPSSVSNRVNHSGEPDSALSFLKEQGFSIAQLKKIEKFRPGYLLEASLDDKIKPRIRALQSLGLPADEIAKIISGNPSLLGRSSLVTSISILKELLETNEAVAKLLKSSSRVLSTNLEVTMVPNIEFLKGCGVPKERTLKLLYIWPRCLLLKPDVISKSLEKVEKMGVSRTSKMFIHALFIVASSKTLKLKFQALRDFGFSESDTLRVFQVAPHLLTRFTKQLERVKDAILATGKYDIFCIIKSPNALSYGIEKRYKPRFQILKILESKNLIENWPALSTVGSLLEKKFVDRYVHPYLSEVGEVYYLAKNSQDQLRKQAEGV